MMLKEIGDGDGGERKEEEKKKEGRKGPGGDEQFGVVEAMKAEHASQARVWSEIV
jgi:hypothetical protein